LAAELNRTLEVLMWIPLTSQQAIDELIERFGGFHDACLREVAISTETFVDQRGSMACPGHLDTTALFYFQSQNRSLSAIEVRCAGVREFRLRPTGEDCDSIISFGVVSLEDEWCRIAIHFIGGPMHGPPHGGVWLSRQSRQEPDLEVVSRGTEWRPLEQAYGTQLRYQHDAK
jgi:hypothetical protein